MTESELEYFEVSTMAFKLAVVFPMNFSSQKIFSKASNIFMERPVWNSKFFDEKYFLPPGNKNVEKYRMALLQKLMGELHTSASLFFSANTFSKNNKI